jgi:DNA gyrase subunit A
MGSRQVMPDNDVMLVSNKGQMIRIHVAGISEQGRNTQGVRLMTLSEGEKVMNFEMIVEGGKTGVPAVDAVIDNGSDPSGGGETVH